MQPLVPNWLLPTGTKKQFSTSSNSLILIGLSQTLVEYTFLSLIYDVLNTKLVLRVKKNFSGVVLKGLKKVCLGFLGR